MTHTHHTPTGCAHASTRVTRTRCFAAPVVDRCDDQNRAAHGSITVTEECRACGATRALNCNGRHQEVGPWGPPSEDHLARRAGEAWRAKDGVRAARERVEWLRRTGPAPVDVTGPRGRRQVFITTAGEYVTYGYTADRTPSELTAAERAEVAARYPDFARHAEQLVAALRELAAAEAAYAAREVTL